ncbi:MAG: potassium transporter KtrB [Clostridia bacterium]|nr:potassium transporter KtrB [Clostridia bacterium]MBQ7048820.1 potassium transporter KtrB [Clostridia bacterium]
MKQKRKLALSTTQIILLSFFVTILLGSVLLALPISSATGEAVPYVDALFTATTSTCVTGLVTLPTVSSWSTFGQVVILILIQVGGLGIVTIVSGLMLLLNRKMGIGDRLLIQDAFNLNTMAGLAKFVRNVLFGTLIIECIGALLYMLVFVPEFGAKGIWISVFTSVSAFCNAGIDIIAENSLCNYATNLLLNTVTSALVILGGLGYIVWWDVLRVVKSRSAKNKKIFRHLTLHSKIAVTVTAGLVLVGGILIFVFEYSNPLTIGEMSLFDKIQVSFFQSVTTRTAGFATIPQENLTNASTAVSVILMLIGGSPVGTAGGMKTVTIAVLVCSAVATIRNKNNGSLFGRRISENSVKKAVAVAVTFITICTTSAVLLMATSDASVVDAVYETVSATGTVGLTRNLTATLSTFGKLIIIATMYFGRVGPISLAVAFGSKNESQNVISEPTEEISIG